MLYISLSAVNDFTSCERLYYNKYVLRVVPRHEKIAPLRGTVLHRYLELYYNLSKVWNGKGCPERAHRLALEATMEEFKDTYDALLIAANTANDPSIIEEFQKLPGAVRRIADRYFAVRGEADWHEYEVLLVEQGVKNVMIGRGIRSNGKVDLVLRSRVTGRVSLVEHKTTESVPAESVRLKDLQTLLYRAKLRWLLKYGPAKDRRLFDFPDPQEVIWNYIYTKEPVQGDDLFNKPTKDYPMGPPSKDKKLLTTWYYWAKAMTERGLDPLAPEWSAIRERIVELETKKFYPRYHKVMVAAPRVLLRDYAQTGEEIKAKRRRWAQNKATPMFTGVRTRKCNYCEYERLCMSLLTGDPEDEVMANALATDYKQKPDPKEKSLAVS